jgi:hypothetical protein
MPPASTEPNLTPSTVQACPWYQPLCQVTPVSKYLAMVIFIAMPFVGGYVGYKLAPEKVVEVMTPVQVKVVEPAAVATRTTPVASNLDQNGSDTATSTIVTVYISAIDLNHSGVNGDPVKITLDYFDVISGEEGARILVNEGKCSKEIFDEDWGGCYISLGFIDHNVNPKLRTFNVAVPYQVFDDRENTISLKELETLLATTRQFANIPFSITLNEKGEVSKIEQQFRP